MAKKPLYTVLTVRSYIVNRRSSTLECFTNVFFQAKNLECLSENLKTDNEDMKAKMNSIVDKLKEVRLHSHSHLPTFSKMLY